MEVMEYSDEEAAAIEQNGEEAVEVLNEPNESDQDDEDDILMVEEKVSTQTSKAEGVNDGDIKKSQPEDEETGQNCPICLDLWNNAGEHRLCSLPCGHLFGHSCILQWLQVGCKAGNRRCPQCNQKTKIRDIRVIYAKKLSAIDTTEIEALKQELLNVTAQKTRLELEHAHCKLKERLLNEQLTGLRNRVEQLESQQSVMTVRINQIVSQDAEAKFSLEKSLDICKDGTCRVLAFNPWHRTLVVSQKSTNSLFAGYSVRKVNMDYFEREQLIFLHTQAIRDLSFHPVENTLLSSVSFDKNIKMVDIRLNLAVHTYTTESQLWSCCWSGENSNNFLAGAQNGSIFLFDKRQTSGAIGVLENPSDRSPVVSLTSIPPNPGGGISRGGFIACRLNSCYAYVPNNTEYVGKQLPLEGPFVSVRCDKKNNHILVSSRPNSRQPNARHVVCTVEKAEEDAVTCNVIHVFNGGNSQQRLSRPCHVHVEDDTYVAAYQESTQTVPLWSVSTGNRIHSLSISDPIVDLCSYQIENNLYLATLSAKKLRIYSN